MSRSQEPRSTLNPADPSYAGYAYCESVTGIGTWHIRKLSKIGPKYGGGIDTPSLCDMVHPTGAEIPGRSYTGLGGWDIQANITELNLKSCCKRCLIVLQERTR